MRGLRTQGTSMRALPRRNWQCRKPYATILSRARSLNHSRKNESTRSDFLYPRAKVLFCHSPRASRRIPALFLPSCNGPAGPLNWPTHAKTAPPYYRGDTSDDIFIPARAAIGSTRLPEKMRLSELDYDLPEALIAQGPLARRDDARLLVLERRSGENTHSRFYKLARHLRDGDLLVANNTRVFPARLKLRKDSGGAVELLLVRPAEEADGAWHALAHSHRRLKDGTRLTLENGRALKIVGYSRPGRPLVKSDDSIPLGEILAEAGMPALPHYIRRPPMPADLTDYQTVYAEKTGAVAAPTAGLHFTDEVFHALREAGIRTAFLTLHIGPGTFTPLRTPEVEGHSMESEWYTIPRE